VFRYLLNKTLGCYMPSLGGGWPRRFRRLRVSGARSFPGLVHGKGGGIHEVIPLFRTTASGLGPDESFES
jgi:hypothetical protein